MNSALPKKKSLKNHQFTDLSGEHITERDETSEMTDMGHMNPEVDLKEMF